MRMDRWYLCFTSWYLTASSSEMQLMVAPVSEMAVDSSNLYDSSGVDRRASY